MTGSLRDLLAGVAAEHHIDPSCSNTCICEENWVSSLDTTHYAEHLADVQAAAVDGWLSGLRTELASLLYRMNGGALYGRDLGPWDGLAEKGEQVRWLDQADAALAAIREQIGTVQ